jgi:hypothetical protein
MVDPFAISGFILSLASKILSYQDRTYALRKDRRIQIADYFLNISDAIMGAANEIEKTGRSYSYCQELDFYARNLLNTIIDFVPVAEASNYQNNLQNVYRIEMINVSSPVEKERVVRELKGASGTFRAVGYTIKARP